MIHPVRAAILTPEWARRVIAPPHDTLTQAMRERLMADNRDSFIHVTTAPSVTGTHPSGHQSTAMRSAAALQRLLDAGAYTRQTEPRLFVQRVEAFGRVQHSLIGMIDMDEHKLCAHEDTHEASVVSLAASFREMAEMWSPVLATCPGAPWVRDVIDATIAANPVETSTAAGGEAGGSTGANASTDDLLLHAETADGATITLWSVDPANPASGMQGPVRGTQDPASGEVSLAGSVYIIDGHHRVAATKMAGLKRVLVAMVLPEELILAGFDRLISDIDVMPRRIMEILGQFCEIAEVPDENAAIPMQAGWLGIGMGERWYTARRLDLPATTAGQGPARGTQNPARGTQSPVRGTQAQDPAAGNPPAVDSEFIHAQLLPALFGITEPSDPRISYRPSPLATGPVPPSANSQSNPSASSQARSSASSQSGSQPKAKHRSDVFTILSAPVPVEAVFAIADRGETMPPKSTYLVPKVRSGVMLVHC